MKGSSGPKLLFVAVFALLVPVMALAGAADKNSFFVSGSMGANFYLKGSSPEDSPSEGFDLRLVPRVVYFPVKCIGVGGEANFGYASQTGYSSTDIAVGPRAAYFLKFDRKKYPAACCLTPWFGSTSMWMPYAGLSILFLSQTSKYGTISSTSTGYRGRLGAGIAPRIGDRGAAFVELGFETQSMKSGSSTASTHTSNKIYLEGGFGAFLFRGN